MQLERIAGGTDTTGSVSTSAKLYQNECPNSKFSHTGVDKVASVVNNVLRGHEAGFRTHALTWLNIFDQGSTSNTRAYQWQASNVMTCVQKASPGCWQADDCGCPWS